MRHYYEIKKGEPIEILEKMPNGWRVLKGTLTQPFGTVWIAAPEPLFTHDEAGKIVKNPKYKHSLYFENKSLFLEYHEKDERYLKK